MDPVTTFHASDARNTALRENLMSQAADALEAQEKRIRELEGALFSLVRCIGAPFDREQKKREALAELAAHARRVLGGQR